MTTTVAELEHQIDELRRQLSEARETLRAIQDGEVDAVVVGDGDRPQVFTLDTPDKPYRLIVDQLHTGAATLTVEGTILACNDRLAAHLRREPAQLLGRPLAEFVEPAYVPLFVALLHDALAAPVEGEVVLLPADGSRVPLFLGVSALREGVAGVCLVVADLTEQKRRERLVADEALARSILEQVADAVVVCDDAGTVQRASQAAHDLCGQNPVLQPFSAVFPLARRDDPGDAVDVASAWRGATLRGWEVFFARPNGQRAELLLSAGPLLAAGGLVTGAVITLTDITLLREAQDELARRAAQLQEADQRKDEFLAVLAHELRNPLSPIRASLEIMHMRELEDPHMRRSRDIIGRQVAHLTRLVDDLLEVSRIRSGRIQLRSEVVDLGSAVARAIETHRPVLDARGHRVFVRLPERPVRVLADPIRLAQIVGNLLDNAAKYTGDGGEVSVNVAQEGAEAVIRVRDTGIGVPPEMLAKIFDLFTQVQRSLDRSHGGLGIGLALVKRLVDLHGGRALANSDGPGRGSEFLVYLPIADGAPVQIAAETTTATTTTTAPGPGRRLLLVDDNLDAAESLSALLGLLGHDVRIASDGSAALTAAAEFRPDVVLCDIGLPRMDGYQVVAALRAQPRFATTRFVALTGYGRDEDRRRSLAAGFDAHLVKPVELAKLTAALEA
jgi:PAS domain S-box-containing protein